MDRKDEHQSEGAFKVTDRRKFTMDGEARQPDEGEAVVAAPPPPQVPPSPPQPAAAPAEESSEADTAFERIILSFTQTAMMQLGLVALDAGQPLEPDLIGARETIDMLAVLQEKTKGNLSARESRLITETLAELRLAYVGVQRGIARPPARP